MKIKSPFLDELNFAEYLKMRSKQSDYILATDIRSEKMSEQEREIYKQKYEEFGKKYKLMNSKGGAGMVITSNNQVSTPYKLYMDPGLGSLDFAELIIDRCKEKRLDYAIKLMTPVEVNQRGERLVVYGSSAKNISELYDVLNELIQENDSIIFGKPPIFADNIDGRLGFGYDDLEGNMSYNHWMSNTIQKACSKFSEIIKSEVPKEYINKFSSKAKLMDSLRDFPELREKFRLYINEEYMNAIKDVPEIEQFITFDSNNSHLLHTKETDEEKTTETMSLNNSTEQLPEGAEWKLNSRGMYIFKIKGKDGSAMTYSAEVASKKFGVKIPAQKQHQQSETIEKKELPEGAEWKLNSKGKYMLKIRDNESSMSYTVEQAIRKFGVTPPNYKNSQLESKTPIAENPKKSVENIAKAELSRNIQKTSSEIKEGYKYLENPNHTIEDNKLLSE